MRFTALLAFGLGQLALAQNSTTPQSKPNAFPSQIRGFQFYGCVASSAGFPTFSKVASSQDMSNELCAASCPSRFFGVYSTDCYCGEEMDDSNTKRVANDQCSTPCPGNKASNCGGMSGSLRMARRQSAPTSVLMTVYIRVSESSGKNVNGVTAGPSSTQTVTSTHTGTITSCPPEVPNCPIGSPTVTTITSTICPLEPTPEPDHHKVIICYGTFCINPNPCLECAKQRVVCEGEECRPEECHEDDEHWNKIVECDGDDCRYPQCNGEECHKKVVCYGEKCIHEECYGDECKKNLVCHGEECSFEKCESEECHQKVVCEEEECKPVPPCSGPECPVPPPPAPPCSGPECPTPAPPCSGPECPPAPPCSGPECPPPAPTPAPTGGIVPPAPISPEVPVAGSDKMLPALGMGALAGLAFFL